MINKITTSLLFITGISLFGFSQPTFDWVKSGGGTGADIGKDITIDATGNTYVLGEFRDIVDFDPGVGVFNLTSNGSSDIFIQKLDNSGNLVWVKQIGGTDTDRVGSVLVDGNGDVIITGFFKGTVDFDLGPGVNNITSNSGNFDGFVIKLDANGNLNWFKILESTDRCLPSKLQLYSNNDIIIMGQWFGVADFDPGVGVNSLSATGNGWNIFVLKLTSSGDFVWVKQIAGTTDTYVQGFALDLNENILISGYYYETIDLDPGAGVVNYTANPGQEDMFILKLDPVGTYIWSHSLVATTAVTEIANTIAVDNNNNYYFGGSFGSTLDFDSGPGTAALTATGGADGFILKLDEGGNFQWVNHLSGSSEVISMEFDTQNNLILGGIFLNTVDFDSGSGVENLTSNGVRDIFIQKITQSGTFEWVVSMGGIDNDNYSSIALGNNGEIYSTGSFTQVVDFDPGSGVNNISSNGTSDFYVQKLSQCFPTIITPDVATLSNLTGECSVAAPTAPTASNCSGTFNGTPNVTFPITTQGTTVVTWTYNDGNGNTSTQTQNVVIDDVTDPVADVTTLSNITSECEITSLTAPTATDNCVGSVTGTHNVTLPITASGTTTITWTYDDGNGNTSTQMQDVIITPIDNGVTQVDAVTLSADATGYNYQWIDCNNSNQAINGATSQTYVTSSNGSYAVEIDNGTCMITSNCMVINQVGISEIGNTDLVEVYPNPTTGTIHISSSVPFNQVELINALGQKVGVNNISETSKYSLILPEQNGVYFVKVYSNKATVIERIIKR